MVVVDDVVVVVASLLVTPNTGVGVPPAAASRAAQFVGAVVLGA